MRINEFNTEVKLLEIVNRGKTKPAAEKSVKADSFKTAFSQELSKSSVNFSKHAQQRLFSRGIDLSQEKLSQISEAIDKAAVKGSKDTLILDDRAAYVVSIPSRTVITAFSRANLQEGVFTSIDSAVIL